MVQTDGPRVGLALMLQVPGDDHQWRETLRRYKEAGSFDVNEPFPLWLAVAQSHNRCVLGLIKPCLPRCWQVNFQSWVLQCCGGSLGWGMAQPRLSSGLSAGMGLHAISHHAGCAIRVATAPDLCRALYCGCWCFIVGGLCAAFPLGMRLKISREDTIAWPAIELTVKALSLKGPCAVQIVQAAALQQAGGMAVHAVMGEKRRGTEMVECSSRWTEEGLAW